MNESRLAKLAPLSGAGFVLLLIIATGILGVYDYLPTAERLMEVFTGNEMKTMLVGYIGMISAGLLMWFAGSVYTAFNNFEGSSKRLSITAFGGCLASAISLGIGFSGLVATGARLGAEGGITPAGVVTLYDLYGTIIGNWAAFAFAVLVGAAGIIALRTGMYPKWFGWVSILIAIGLITPFGYAVMALVMVWLVGVSISLYRREVHST